MKHYHLMGLDPQGTRHTRDLKKRTRGPILFLPGQQPCTKVATTHFPVMSSTFLPVGTLKLWLLSM